MASSSKKWSAVELTKTLLFRTLTYRAAGFLGKPLLLFRVAKKAIDRAEGEASFRSVANGAVENVKTLARMVRSYATGSYEGVSKKNAILVVAGILYFLSPFDVVPDFLPVVGFLDDITLITWILATVGGELGKFKEFESGNVDSLQAMSYQDLYERAKARDIPGRSGMSKQELVDALSARPQSPPDDFGIALSAN